MPRARIFRYVGPEAMLRTAATGPIGTEIRSRAAVRRWCEEHGDERDGLGLWATYTVGEDGDLRVAPRRSEHVACSGGEPVLAAGEICFAADARVTEISNLSTGFCPDAECWAAVRDALDAASVLHPGAFTFEAVFRRCPVCGERNVVKEGWFVCAVCDAPLPETWNFA